MGAVRRGAGECLGAGPQRPGERDDHECERQDAQRQQQQVFELLANVNTLFAGLQQHGRTERFAIGAFGLQAMQPEGHRDYEQAGEKQGREKTHRYCRRCRNSR